MLKKFIQLLAIFAFVGHIMGHGHERCETANATVSAILSATTYPVGCNVGNLPASTAGGSVLKPFCSCENGIASALANVDLPVEGECPDYYTNINEARTIQRRCVVRKDVYCWPLLFRVLQQRAEVKVPSRSDVCSDCLLNGFDEFENRLNKIECVKKGDYFCMDGLRDLKKTVGTDLSSTAKLSDYCKKGCNSVLPSEIKKAELADTYGHEKSHIKEQLHLDRFLSEKYCSYGAATHPSFIVLVLFGALALWMEEII